MNHSPYSAESLQGWHSPGPPPSAPAASQLANIPHTPHGYSPMPITSHSHIDPTWDSGPPDTSTWGVKYNQKAAQDSEPASKPPLPVSPSSCFLIQRRANSSTLSAEASSTTRPAYFARVEDTFISPVSHDNRGARLPTTCSVRPCLCTAIARTSPASTTRRTNFDTIPTRA